MQHEPLDASAPSPSLTSRRVEFVPQSMAASVAMRTEHCDPGRSDARTRRRLRQIRAVDPAADRVVAAGEVPGVVGVEALHALAGAADAAAGRGAGVVGGRAASRSAA